MRNLIVGFSFSLFFFTHPSEYQTPLILLSNNKVPKAIALASHLVEASPVLKATKNAHEQMKMLKSFGYSTRELKLLQGLLTLEHDHPFPTTKPKSFEAYYHYESAITKMADKFQQRFAVNQDEIKSFKLTQKFELAHFFMLKSAMIVIADIQSTPSCTIEMLQEMYNKDETTRHQKEMLQLVAKRYVTKKAYAKEKYFVYHHTENPFFEGVSVQDLIDHDQHQSLLSTPLPRIYLDSKNINSFSGLQTIADCAHYEIVYARYNRFKEIDPTIEEFFNVHTLYLNSNQLRDIPTYIKLYYLKKLYLDKNQINKIPSDMRYLRNLEMLSLAENQIKKIPNIVEGLEKLQALNLRGNSIKKIPSFIKGLPSLELLDLCNNLITKIPAVTNGLNRVETLRLAGNNIKEIPVSIIGLEHLRTLDLRRNCIKEIPCNIEGLSSLRELNLVFNKINLSNLKIEQPKFWHRLIGKNTPPIAGLENLDRLVLSDDISLADVVALKKSMNRTRSGHRKLHISEIEP